ncbi:zinc ABC transporter substrate-binding protein [Bacillaceae bacterium Marseille-Q3522]|nr:zinc ABC transporter substrate-binding protein [Bacillaceae bacterium Marseille-Q3522]
MKLKTTIFSAMLIIAVFLSGCGTNGQQSAKGNNDKLIVYTTIFPLEDFTKKIGGEFVEVHSVYPPNVEPHSYEPTIRTMTEIADSDLFIYSGAGVEGFAEKAEQSLENENVTIIKAAEGIELLQGHVHVHEGEETHDEHGLESEDSHEEHAQSEQGQENEDAHDEHDHGDFDPHVWLDPVRAITIAENIKNALVNANPEAADQFAVNFEQLKNELLTLDKEFADTISKAKTKYMLVSHAAYGYWQDRYGVEQIAISGLSPSQEPSQKQLTEIIAEAETHDLHYVIFDQNVESKVAEVIRNNINAEAVTLNNLESISEEDVNNQEDYFSLMRKNLEVLNNVLND